MESQSLTEYDTIVALSTAPGRSAIAVVRLSGLEAFSVASRIVTPWPLRPRYARLCELHEPDSGALIDRCVVSIFPSPQSYTGENTVEFSTHGGDLVPHALVDALLRAGAREAQAGEFTRRALLNGKLDLLQAEAIGDLIDATSGTMRQVALFQLDGGLSRRIDELRNRLLDLEALLAYDIDFPEEDHGMLSRTRVTGAAASVQDVLRSLLDTAPAAELIRTGAIIVIAGRPNVGKSSLFNALVGEKRAIVTDVPGTTRDAIEMSVEIGTWPMRIVDTAGLRTTDDVVERLGIEVSERYLSSAHVIVACDDDMGALPTTVDAVGSAGFAPIVPVLTKVDGPSTTANAALANHNRTDAAGTRVVCVSALTRRGIPELAARLAEVLTTHYGSVPVTRPALTRTRQRLAIERASSELTEFERHWRDADLPTPVAAVHIRSAIDALDDLIGAVDTEEVLGRVFATFCIGK